MHATFNINFFGAVRVTQAFLPLLRKSNGARIVLISSGLGSITLAEDMKASTWSLHVMGYSASKAALNMFTAKLAKELLGAGMKVNAGWHGSVATDMGGAMAPRTVEQGAVIAVRLATLGWAGPTGGFFRRRRPGPRTVRLVSGRDFWTSFQVRATCSRFPLGAPPTC
jgi:NAD(P)-dependent dehydrogenase (short-subunit alcohol dehydrogenase family)